MAKNLFLKLTVIGIIVVVLLVAMYRITGLVYEREARQLSAAIEIQGAWSGPQQVAGPVLMVPVRGPETPGWTFGRTPVLGAPAKRSSGPETLYLLPESLSVESRVTPHLRHRGLFETVVYSASLTLSGHFQLPEADRLGRAPEDLQWQEARLVFGLSELRGLRESPRLRFGEKEIELSPASAASALFSQTIDGRDLDAASLAAGGRTDFELALEVNGSGLLEVLPLGRETRMVQTSGWPDPSFQGAFLPAAHEVGEDGFSAEWTIPQFARTYPQFWIAGGALAEELRHAVADSAFGTGFLPPVDFYQRVSRCTKYAILFVTLTFALFFFFELLAGLRIHPMQYLMVGLAICLFYLLLLAAAEHIGFGPAYLAAAAATVILIAGYSAAVLRTARRAATLAAALASLYGVLYVLVQTQTYTLLIGSIGLFLALALAMYLTRHVDWYRLGPSVGPSRRGPAEGEPAIQAS